MRQHASHIIANENYSQLKNKINLSVAQSHHRVVAGDGLRSRGALRVTGAGCRPGIHVYTINTASRQQNNDSDTTSATSNDEFLIVLSSPFVYGFVGR